MSKTKTLTIIDAVKDDNLFRPYFGDEYASFRKWRVALKCIYGIKITSEYDRQVVRDCTGRDPDKLNPEGYGTTLLLCGRRSGKSKIVAVIGAYSAALAGMEKNVSAGEQGVVAVISNTRKQGTLVRNYCRALFDAPMLAREIIKDRSSDVFQLKNGNRLEILAADMRSVRGFTCLAAIVDECAHFGLAGVSKTRTDFQIIAAIEPSLITTGGKLIALTTPFGKSGWAYETHRKHFGQDSSDDVLVWCASSKYMHEGLSQKFLDRKKAEDLQNYLCEFESQFRDDVSNFISIEDIEALVVRGRRENMFRPEHQYSAFVDVSGGRGDASALAIAHKDNKSQKYILDVLQWHPSPHKPAQVIATMAKKLHEWGITRITGDSYAAEFAAEAFRTCGIQYTPVGKTKSELYLDLLPLLSNKAIELLDHDRMIKQFGNLERRTVSGGADRVDHPTRQNDDLSNAVAGVIHCCNQRRLIFGAISNVGTVLQTSWR